MTNKLTSLLLVSSTLLFAFVHLSEAVGGVAELKALTGDAPYVGYGNQEQAPEYFGDALYRQYYQNPSYGYAPQSPWSRYQMNTAATMYGGAYRGGMASPYYASGAASPQVAAVAPIAGPVASGGTGGFYTGGGNEWVKSRK